MIAVFFLVWGAFMNIDGYNRSNKQVNLRPQDNVARALPPDLAKRLKVLPLELRNGTLRVAVSNPSDVWTLDEVHLATGYKIKPVFANPDHIVAELTSLYGPLDDIAYNSGQTDMEQGLVLTAESTDSTSIGSIVDSMFQQAIGQRASDIHLDPNREGGRVRLRIDGILHPQISLDPRIFAAVTTAIKVRAGMDIAQRLIPQDGRLEYTIGNKQIDIRVASLPTTTGEKIVLRLLHRTGLIDSIDQLRFTNTVQEALLKFAARSGGMILVTGPTACGKTTTLYALLKSFNSAEQNIITIEDPVEYHLPGINQVQINPKAGLTFARGLRSILRQDPNIIMVGEIRDSETAEIAVRSALTGHLVLSTLHTNDAASTIARLLDMGIEPYLLVSALNGILSQRLVRSVCSHCSQLYQPADYEETIMINYCGPGRKTWTKGVGCPFCRYTGYLGRIPIGEVLDARSDSIQSLILDCSTADEIRQQAVREGMKPLLADGLVKVALGRTTMDEVMLATGWLAEYAFG